MPRRKVGYQMKKQLGQFEDIQNPYVDLSPLRGTIRNPTYQTISPSRGSVRNPNYQVLKPDKPKKRIMIQRGVRKFKNPNQLLAGRNVALKKPVSKEVKIRRPQRGVKVKKFKNPNQLLAGRNVALKKPVGSKKLVQMTLTGKKATKPPPKKKRARKPKADNKKQPKIKVDKKTNKITIKF